MKFTQAIINKNGLVQKIPGTNKWEVKESFVWYINYESKTEFINVPVGFVTDFGSIPKFFLLFFNPTKYIAYILHDFLYGIGLNRKQADLALLDGLKGEGAGYIERIFVYISVRCFGWINYNKK